MKLSREEIDTLLMKSMTPQIQLIKQISQDQFRWKNDPNVIYYSRNPRPVSPLEHEGWLQEIENNPKYEYFGVLGKEKPSDMFGEIGTVGLQSIDFANGNAEFSILIDPREHRKGYGKLALTALLRHAFQNLRLHCVYGETMKDNPALELFLQVGFQIEGTFRERYFKKGVFMDSVAISIVKKEAESESWWS